jgi:NADPH-dependent curcumin reductase CurA
MGKVLRKGMTLRGFIDFDDFGHLYPEFAEQMGDWVRDRWNQYHEEMIEGLERAHAAFVDFLNGTAVGKRVAELSV